MANVRQIPECGFCVLQTMRKIRTLASNGPDQLNKKSTAVRVGGTFRSESGWLSLVIYHSLALNPRTVSMDFDIRRARLA
jgi:hypothetical protein